MGRRPRPSPQPPYARQRCRQLRAAKKSTFPARRRRSWTQIVSDGYGAPAAINSEGQQGAICRIRFTGRNPPLLDSTQVCQSLMRRNRIVNAQRLVKCCQNRARTGSFVVAPKFLQATRYCCWSLHVLLQTSAMTSRSFQFIRNCRKMYKCALRSCSSIVSLAACALAATMPSTPRSLETLCRRNLSCSSRYE